MVNSTIYSIGVVNASPSAASIDCQRHRRPPTTAIPGQSTAGVPEAVRPEAVSDALKCSICLNIATNPANTPCQHLFCYDCITKAFSNGCTTCPNCRSSCTSYQLERLSPGGLLYRVWSDIEVKCSNHAYGCKWTGSIVEEPNHKQTCQSTQQYQHENEALRHDNATLRHQVESLRAQTYQLERENETLEEEKEDLVGRLNSIIEGHEQSLDKLEERNLVLTKQKKELSDQLQELAVKTSELLERNEQYQNDHRLSLPILFHENYNFHRGNIIQLAQLISRYLKNRPSNIDRNRIFNCVRLCVQDLERNFADNPRKFYENVRMLLTTCASCNWFTPNQQTRIDNWLDQQGWK